MLRKKRTAKILLHSRKPPELKNLPVEKVLKEIRIDGNVFCFNNVSRCAGVKSRDKSAYALADKLAASFTNFQKTVTLVIKVYPHRPPILQPIPPLFIQITSAK